MTDHHQNTFSLYWEYQRDSCVVRTLLLLLLSLSFSFVTKAQGQDRIVLPAELEIKLDKIIELEQQMVAANFPMVGYEGKQSLSEIKEKREEGTLTEEEAEAYMATILEIVKRELNAIAELLKPKLDPTLSFEEGLRKHWEGGDEESAIEGAPAPEEEEACLAPYPKVIGTMEGESTISTTESGRIKGEPQTCSKVWYYYLGPIGGYQPIVRGDAESAKAGWYDDFEYRTILREYGMAFAIAVGDVHSPIINSNRRDESSALLVSRFQEDRELSASFERFISRHYGYFSKQAEREFSGSGEVNPVYPLFNVLDILAGGGLSGLKALTRQLAKRSWLQGGRQIRRIAPEAPIKVGDDVIEITNQQGEVLFKVTDDELEITSKAFLPEGEEVVFREQIANDLPISSGSGQNLSGQVELVKTKRGNLHVEVVAKTGDDLFSAFGTLNKLSNETKAAISSKGWGDDVLKQLDNDLGSPSSELFRRLDQEVELVNSWKVLDDAGVDETLRRNIDALADPDAALDAIQMSQKAKPTWPEIQALWKRGNDFNAIGRNVYRYNEVTLGSGKRLDSYIPGKEIVSRKATTLSQIQPNTFRNYLNELIAKYKVGEPINAPKFGTEFNGKVLEGDYFLEIPTSNRTFFEGSAEYKKVLSDFNKANDLEIKIKYLDE